MGYDGLLGVSTQLKNAYSRIIYPFDTFVAQVRGTTLTPAVQKYTTRSSANSPLRTAKHSASRPPNSNASNSSAKGLNGHANGNLPTANGNGKHRSLSPSTGSSFSSLSSKEDVTADPPLHEATDQLKPVSPHQASPPLPSTTPNKSSALRQLLTHHPYLLMY